MADWKQLIEPVSEVVWKIPKSGDMRVPGIFYISRRLLDKALADNAPQQVVNVAKLPGILKFSLAMPDVHWGYGAPIGGVAAFSDREGVIVPGFVGYDINCGVRLIRSDLVASEISGRIGKLVDALYVNIPSGVGSTGKIYLKRKQLEKVLLSGAPDAVNNGYGWASDLEHTEESGSMESADPDAVSDRAYERGAEQLGTLGSGNHFLEIQQVVEIYEPEIADVFGLFPDQVVIMIHTGSRGLGYQVCDDYLRQFMKSAAKYGLQLPDMQLASAPADSSEGKAYFAAMSSAANFAWANRQIITHWVRESFAKVLEMPPERLGLSVVYDVAHNIAKYETHAVEGKNIKVYVHRKGATRAFPSGHPDVPALYRKVGQPVIIPGTMGTSSYVLAGTATALAETWGSTCHGAGRMLSRHQAMKESRNRRIVEELATKGIVARAKSRQGLGEEIPEAYKDVDEIVDVVVKAGLSKKVAKMKPLAVIKG